MEQRNGQPSAQALSELATDVTSTLTEAQERAREQRLAVEELLAEARALEEKLAVEVHQARAGAERALAREHAAAAVSAAQREHEAITQVEACAANVALLTDRRAELEHAAAQAHVAVDAASVDLRECEQRLSDARHALLIATQQVETATVARDDAIATEAAAQSEAAVAAELLAERRSARQQAESASAQAEERARAMGAFDGDDRPPSLEPTEELRLLEARVALRAEASKRAAERRAADAARNHVSH